MTRDNRTRYNRTQKLPVRMQRLSIALLNVLFPNPCPGCSAPLRTNDFPLCPACTFQMERVDEAVARSSICKLPPACNAFDHVFALWYFDKAGTIQHIHQGLKYKNRPFYGVALGKLMGKIFLRALDPRQRPDLIIPVPLHRKRLLERGYNQSEALARGMAHSAGIRCNTRTLQRTAYTQTQTGLDSARRLENVARAFDVKTPRHISNKHILLVDDVLTTGATLYAASQPLKQAGASAISIATFAMARP